MEVITTPSLSLEFSTQEFWFLLNLFGPGVVLGMEEPYLGWLMEEREAAHREALRSLVDRGLVRMVSNDEIDLDDVLAQMVQACVRPQHSLILHAHRASPVHTDDRRYVHWGEMLLVEHHPIDEDRHRLTALPDRDALLSNLEDVLRLNTPVRSVGEGFVVKESALFQARQHCRHGKSEKALAILQDAGLQEDTAARLVKALISPVANSAAVVVVNRMERDTRHVRGMAVLEGEEDLWIMTPYEHKDTAYVWFTPAEAQGLREKLLAILP